MGTWDTIKCFVIGCAILGLICWNVMLQTKHQEHELNLKAQEGHVREFEGELKANVKDLAGKVESHDDSFKDLQGKFESQDSNLKVHRKLINVSRH
jgi:hypothetical protein